MFFEVIVRDKKGKIKKVLSPKELNIRYWRQFFDLGKMLKRSKKGPKLKKSKVTNYQEPVENVLDEMMKYREKTNSKILIFTNKLRNLPQPLPATRINWSRFN